MSDLDDLIRLHGDAVRALSESEYLELAIAACGDTPGVRQSVTWSRGEPQRRLKNLIRGRVLRHLHRESLGEIQEVDTSGFSLF